jgi:hypothetical protein
MARSVGRREQIILQVIVAEHLRTMLAVWRIEREFPAGAVKITSAVESATTATVGSGGVCNRHSELDRRSKRDSTELVEVSEESTGCGGDPSVAKAPSG